MPNYSDMWNTGVREGDIDTALHAKKQLIASLLNEIDVTNRREGRKNDPGAGAPSSPYVHGSGGLLATAGLSPLIFSAMVQPHPGLASALPRLDRAIPYPDDFGGVDTPYLVTLTGQTEGNLDDFANQPEEPCDDAPYAGLLKRCVRTAPYGQYSARTRPIYLRDVGKYTNQGETPDFRIANNFQTDNPFVPEGGQWTGGSWLQSEWMTRFKEMGTSIQRLLSPNTYSGNPTNSTNASREFQGLNLFYTTNPRDISGVTCPAAGSFIYNYNALYTGTSNGLRLYEVIESMYRYFVNLADMTGMSPVTWDISMDRDLFFELSNIIPIQQYTRVIATMDAISSGDGRLNISGETANQVRYDMWQNRYLPLAGTRVKVHLEDPATISATYNPATNLRNSRIYFNPVYATGNTPVTYWQFRNMGNRQAQEMANQSNGFVRFTDNGRFLWTFNSRNGCMEWTAQFEPRLMSHAPFLGGYIDNVQYSTSVWSRSPYPSDSSFYFNGGLTETPYVYGVTDYSNGASVVLDDLGY